MCISYICNTVYCFYLNTSYSCDYIFHITCIPDLLEVITRSSTPNPCSALVDCVWNIKDWIEPYLQPLEGHSKYGVFRFTLNPNGWSELHYKQRSNMPWLPEEAGIRVILVKRLMSLCTIY